MNQDIKNLIGLTYEDENGKDYKIVGIKDVTEDYITLDIELVQEEKISWDGKLLVDIGHGGTKTVNGKTVRDYGAVNDKSKVDEFTWNHDFVMRYIIPELQKAGIKYQIVLRDVGITKLINDLNKAAGKDDIILSFHLNSGVATATGTETLYWHTSTKGKKLAEIVQKNLVSVLGLANRGIKIRRKPINKADELNQRGWTMFRDTKVPYVMLESFFISNDKDLKIGTERKTELAKAVVTAIKEYIK
ncbi:N-acetylmuramoyl-L-alanine amidase family protein [Sebaldella termitidis]|uniref:N-acetylmuramoyl-L-alanine amidase family protein n=1 Tax=Sebaldella termitidis TaxID=826 RepID=UPI003EBFCEBF